MSDGTLFLKEVLCLVSSLKNWIDRKKICRQNKKENINIYPNKREKAKIGLYRSLSTTGDN